MEEEDGELGSFQTMNELARWAFALDDDILLRDVFAAVEAVYADGSLVDGAPLAIEFFESVCVAGRAAYDPLIGEASRRWFDAHGW